MATLLTQRLDVRVPLGTMFVRGQDGTHWAPGETLVFPHVSDARDVVRHVLAHIGVPATCVSTTELGYADGRVTSDGSGIRVSEWLHHGSAPVSIGDVQALVMAHLCGLPTANTVPDLYL